MEELFSKLDDQYEYKSDWIDAFTINGLKSFFNINVENLHKIPLKQVKEMIGDYKKVSFFFLLNLINKWNYVFFVAESQRRASIVNNTQQEASSNIPKATSNASETSLVDNSCKICMDAEIDCVYVECGHMLSCWNCSKNLKDCPYCRQKILKAIKTYRA